jgi:nucleoid-associated protein YgaU
MSKHDKSKIVNIPGFKGAQRIQAEDKTPDITPKDADADEKTPFLAGLWTKLTAFFKKTSFFSGLWGKLTAFSQKTWDWCRSTALWTWSGLRKIPSYCVIRWDSEDETESPETNANTNANVNAKPAPVKAVVNTTPATAAKPESKAKTAPADVYDEDELLTSRWWSLGIKAAAVSAAVLILAGGYFAAKTMFKAPAENAEIVALTDQTSGTSPEKIPAAALVQNTSAPPPQPAPVIPQIAAAHDAPKPELSPAIPLQGSPFDNNDPFASQTAPAIAANAPPVTADPFGAAANVITQQPPAPVIAAAAPAPSKNAAESELPPELTALRPLTALEPVQITQPHLQPLVALNSSAQSAAAPVAAVAAANVPVARNYNNRQAARNQNNSAAPTPPAVDNLPKTAIRQTLPIAAPVKEIVPQIPPSGTVERVPPPPAPPTPVIAAPSTRAMNPTESAPAIPKDAPIASASVPVVTVPPVPASAAAEGTPQILPVDSQPMDWQLWEQLRELRNDTEAEPSKLRLDGAAAASEPALRFTPKQTPPPANTGNALLGDAVDQFSALQLTDELSPDAPDIASFLPALENAPKPAIAEVQPAYRTGQANREKGMTFQSRIDSEITRSPSAPEQYVVQRGDTYMTISDKFYGTSLLYTALAAHNQKLGIGWRPAEGVVIEIPTAEYLRMHYGEAAHQPERRLVSQRSAIRYVVQEGDTIFRLATDRLQDSTRWREIYAMNTDRIQDVRNLKPGTEILLPGL